MAMINVIGTDVNYTEFGTIKKSAGSNNALFIKEGGNKDGIPSGKQAALECNAVPLETFIFELHRRVDCHFATVK